MASGAARCGQGLSRWRRLQTLAVARLHGRGAVHLSRTTATTSTTHSDVHHPKRVDVAASGLAPGAAGASSAAELSVSGHEGIQQWETRLPVAEQRTASSNRDSSGNEGFSGSGTDEGFPGAGALLHAPPASAYVHIPFCRARCHYCDFAVVTGPSATADSTHRRYVDTLVAEVTATTAAVRERGCTPIPVDTVYFGGGTPSLMAPALVEEVLDCLDQNIGIAADAEITLELDPGTFDTATLSQWIALGITRASVGVQSLNDSELQLCNRQHSAADARAALEAVSSSALKTWSLDLIHSLPHQTLPGWLATIEAAVAYAPPHLSVYTLAVEPKTRFAALYRPDTAPLPTETVSADMFVATSDVLTGHGFEHYEIMSFAKSAEHQSRHNLNYWAHRSWYGFGMSAASHTFGATFSRPRTLGGWRRWVNGGAPAIALDTFLDLDADNKIPPEWREQAVEDMVMLGLRRARGIDLADVAAVGGRPVAAAILEACRTVGADFLRVQTASAPASMTSSTQWPTVSLTRPEGMLRENEVLSRLVSLFG